MFEPTKIKANYKPRPQYKGQDKKVAQGLTSYYNATAKHDNAVSQGLTDTYNQSPEAAGPPVDPTLMAQTASANLGIQLGNAWDKYQGGQIETSFGNLNDPSQDAVSNPFSQAALAYRRYNESQSGTTNSYANSGQLYSGALQNASETNTRDYAQGLDSLRKAKQGQLDSLTKGALDRYSQTGATVNSDTLASLMKLLGQG